MKIVCAWCNETLDEKNPSSSAEELVSHGICAECARKMLAPLAVSMTVFLDRFPAPVFLVNDDARVIAANNKAYSLLGKKPEDVDGKLGGDAIDCKYAELPGGCGKTVHCKSCTIRLTVTDTLQTGQSHFRVPAYPDLHLVTGDRSIQFYISTQKAGDSVFLIIEEMNIIDE
jgi:PAS domain-containing protein